MFKFNNYKTLIPKLIDKIPYDINYESLKKLNISLNTLRKKETKKMTITEFNNLNKLINRINNPVTDEKFKETVLRNLKLFLMYGHIYNIEYDMIQLKLTTTDLTTDLIISANLNSINMHLTNEEYTEEAIENNNSISYHNKRVKKKETSTSYIYDIEEKKTSHFFYKNNEICSKHLKERKNYIEDKKTKKRIYAFSLDDNYQEKKYYYREKGYIMYIYKLNYFLKAIAKKHDLQKFMISKGSNKENKYLNEEDSYECLKKEDYLKYLNKKLTLKELVKKRRPNH